MRRTIPIFAFLKLCAALAAGVLLLSSCITVDERLTINSNDSGVMNLNYKIARIALDLPEGTNTVRTIPLPTDPNAFAAAVRGAPGLNLERFTPIDETEDVGAQATIAFPAVQNLNRVLGKGSGVDFAITKNGTTTTFTQTLYGGNPAGVDQQTLALVKELFGGERLVFALTPPAPVRSVNLGTISSDGKTASYTTTVPAIIQARKPVVWEVRW